MEKGESFLSHKFGESVSYAREEKGQAAARPRPTHWCFICARGKGLSSSPATPNALVFHMRARKRIPSSFPGILYYDGIKSSSYVKRQAHQVVLELLS